MKNLFIFAMLMVGCGGAVEQASTVVDAGDAGDASPPLCSYPKNVFVVSFVELEGTCGPLVDQLFDSSAPLSDACNRNSVFNQNTCNSTFTEVCKRFCSDDISMTESVYSVDWSLYGDAGSGSLRRTVTSKDANENCTSLYAVSLKAK